MKKLILLATLAFALVTGTAALTMVYPQSAAACATWHCGCQDHPNNSVPCRE
jgi:hypothetical protein